VQTPASGRPSGLPRPAGFRLPALGLLLAGLGLAALEGGFAASRWYPVEAGAVCVAVVALATGALGLARGQRPIAIALTAFAALTAWSYASILWADVPADAIDGSNRMLLFLLAFALAAGVPWPAPAARAVLAGVAAGVGLLAIGTLVASGVASPADLIIDGRLSAPLGYANATASLWLIALWPAAQCAVDDDLPIGVRAAALGAGALLLEMALLTQSRGAALALAVVTIAFVAAHPRRGAVMIALAAALAATGLAAGPLLAVRHLRATGDVAAALSDARAAIALTAGGLAVLAAIALMLVARTAPSRGAGSRRRSRRLGDRVAGALAVVGTLGVLLATGSPVGWANDRWHDFSTTGYDQVEAGPTRLSGSLGSNRYDFYRVALDEFRDHPLTGIGADNFQVPYLQQRRSDEAPRYPHSLGLQVLSQLGLVGLGAFLVMLAGAAVAVGRALRSTPAARGRVVAAAAGFLVFLVQAMGDWLWSFPALGIVAFILLGVAVRGGDEPPPVVPTRRLRGPALGALGAVAAVAVLGFSVLALSARLVRSAGELAASDPTAARSQLALAARLNPFDADPLVSGAILARRGGAPGEARVRLDAALERQPRSWFAHFERGLLAAGDGDRAAALARLGQARALNPRQAVVTDAIAALRAGRPVDPDALETALAQQLERKLQPTGG
jgi:O-antigen ligase